MKTPGSQTLPLISLIIFLTEASSTPLRHRRSPLELGYVVGVDGPVHTGDLHHHHVIAAHHVIVHPHILVVAHPKEAKVTHKLAIKTETHVISHDPKPAVHAVVLIPIGAHSVVVKHEVKVANLRTHLGGFGVGVDTGGAGAGHGFYVANSYNSLF